MPPQTFFKEVNSIISSFIWSNKESRLKRKLLYHPRAEGGLNLPNLELYQVAAQAFYIDRIINKTNEDPWIDIENNQLQGNSLLFALFSRNNVKSTNFVINSALIAWNKILKNLHQEIRLPRHIAIWNNPSINIQGVPLHWETWIKSGIQRLSDVIKHNTVVPFSELKNKYNLKDTELFRYTQLKNWIIRNFDSGKNTRPEISNIFKTVKWTEDLAAEVKEKWKECLSLTYKLTTNENLHLIQFRVMTRVYHTRNNICKFDNTASDKCLKCKRYSDSLMHALWYCKSIKKILESIESWLCKSTNKTMVFLSKKVYLSRYWGHEIPDQLAITLFFSYP